MKRAMPFISVDFVFWILLALAVLSMTFGALTSQFPAAAIAPVAIGIIWALARNRLPGLVAHAGFLLFCGMAAGGITLGIAASPMLVGVVTSMAAWDVQRFQQRLKLVKKSSETDRLQQRHLRILLFTCAAGLLVGLIPLFNRQEFPFSVVFFLALFLVIMLTGAVRYLHQDRSQVDHAQ